MEINTDTVYFTLPIEMHLISNIVLPTSHIPHPTSNFPHPTSHIQLPTSYFPHPTSHFKTILLCYECKAGMTSKTQIQFCFSPVVSFVWLTKPIRLLMRMKFYK